MKSNFKDKVVWVTGASSGIGESLCYHLSELGAKLIISSRKENALSNVKKACKSSNDVHVLPLDLAQHDTLFDKTKVALSYYGDIDILINAGGISQRSLAAETDLSVYHKMMDVNYFGSIYLTKHLLPTFLKNNKGQFVAISSTAGKIGVPVRSGYSAAKHALHGFFESLRAELSKTKIEITILCPGYIKTDISKNALIGDGSQQNKMDDAQANGMSLETFTPIALRAIANRKSEKYIGGLRDTTLAIYTWRLFPNLLRKIIAKAKVT